MKEKDLVIVTGSCGRIGTQVVKRLKKDYSIIGLDLLRAIYASKQEEALPMDLSSDESVAQAFDHIRKFHGKRIASIIHLAAYYSFKDKFSPLYEKITLQGTVRILKAARDFEIEQFIFTSTELVHKPNKPGNTINEDSPLDANWGYPISKIQTEHLIHESKGSIPALILRVAGVYDDECHSIPISNQIQRIYEKKIEARLFPGRIDHGAAFVHMEDLVDAIELSVKKRRTLPKECTLLIGEPKTLSMDQMQRMISRLLFGKEFKTFRIPKYLAKIGSWIENRLPGKSKPFIQPWMIEYADDHYELDITRAKNTLGWQPRHSLEETLPIMIKALKKDPSKWYKDNGLST